MLAATAAAAVVVVVVMKPQILAIPAETGDQVEQQGQWLLHRHLSRTGPANMGCSLVQV